MNFEIYLTLCSSVGTDLYMEELSLNGRLEEEFAVGFDVEDVPLLEGGTERPGDDRFCWEVVSSFTRSSLFFSLFCHLAMFSCKRLIKYM